MTDSTDASRRTFLKGGALAAAPLAAAGAAGIIARNRQEAELARLRDEAAIRDLHQAWLRSVNAGQPAEAARLFVDAPADLHRSISRVSTDSAGAPDRIELASDGRSATGRFACEVRTDQERPRDCTLAQMAHAQGEGVIRLSERRLMTARYVKIVGGWAIETLGFEPA